MTRYLRPLLFAVALLFSQHAAMLHGLAHAEHELALAAQGDKAPALGHGSDVCAAFGALANALGNAAPDLPVGCAGIGAPGAVFSSFSSLTRVVFDSRAPPLSA